MNQHVRDFFTGGDPMASQAAFDARKRKEQWHKDHPSALDSDPFGWVLIAALTLCLSFISPWIGIPFLVWALWLGAKPCV